MTRTTASDLPFGVCIMCKCKDFSIKVTHPSYPKPQAGMDPGKVHWETCRGEGWGGSLVKQLWKKEPAMERAEQDH